MPEPIVGSGFAMGKLYSGVAGFFGGLSVSFFWQPKKLHSYGKLAAGAIIGGISVAAAIAAAAQTIKAIRTHLPR